MAAASVKEALSRSQYLCLCQFIGVEGYIIDNYSSSSNLLRVNSP